MEDTVYVKGLSTFPPYLTQTELDIVKGIVEGKTAEAIAIERKVSRKTVETHRHNMLKRTNCRSMPQLVAKLFRDKILS